MLCVGTDIIEIDRIEKVVQDRGARFLHRVFTEAELEQCQTKAASLAARFAGKEAVYKALGATNQGIGWQDIEILASPRTAPLVCLHGAALTRAAELGIDRLAISLSHSRQYAIAVAIGESKKTGGHSPQ